VLRVHSLGVATLAALMAAHRNNDMLVARRDDRASPDSDTSIGDRMVPFVPEPWPTQNAKRPVVPPAQLARRSFERAAQPSNIPPPEILMLPRHIGHASASRSIRLSVQFWTNRAATPVGGIGPSGG
jgi:hypothetical protein